MSDELKRIGAQMANVMFNLSQGEGQRLTHRSTQTMADLYRKWDEAVRATPSPSTAPTERPSEIKIPEGPTLRYEERTTGKPGWLLYHHNGELIRAMSVAEVELIEASLVAGAARQGGNTSAKSVESGTAPTVEVDDLPQIDYDKAMDRTYIPLPGGWEIQTKGNGSTFRIAHIGSRTRWMVLDDNLHEPLEAMARDMRNALASKPPAREAAERQSIDTPAFEDLVSRVGRGQAKLCHLIAHIDTWGGAAPAAGNTAQSEE